MSLGTKGMVMTRYFFDTLTQGCESSVVCRDDVGTELSSVDCMLTEAHDLIPEIVKEQLGSSGEMTVTLSVRDSIGLVVYRVKIDVCAEAFSGIYAPKRRDYELHSVS